MEELRSTVILDKEIKADARKKAERVLKNAEAEIEKIQEEITEYRDKTKKQKEEYYARLIKNYTQDAEAAIPLEKQRRYISFVDKEIANALQLYFDQIGEEKRLQIIFKLLKTYSTVLKEKKIEVYYKGYSDAQIKKLITGALPKTHIQALKKLSDAEASALHFDDGVYIETVDKSLMCRASIQEIMNDLLHKKRQELAEVLFGSGVIT
ncbi:hypothetical protein [Treponema phagedenis]|uniref:hypothetical protein n=1 Tax=Treponema phagedenis TaxID=162 RepID=UPI0001F63B9B|nr:hypothetical protein [Treponema phagedenis]EFW38522.1 hypothetical protein HMPREF9554_00974 [Treponema phagedenis F0421]TYT79471.1 ATPase [Treponema phagedenis]